MPTLNLPNVRIDSDMRLNVSLTDNNVAVNWTSLTGIHAYAYSDAQRILAGELEASVDPTDSTKLIVNYRATVPQYLGICRLVVRGTYQNRQKTYDKQVANFVETTAAATGVTVVTDPVVNVQLSVNEVSTSILDEAIDACIAATANATSAATAANTAAAKFNAAVVQTTGQATDKVMSQKAVTDAINAGGGSADAVKYTPQTLTTPQKAQARMNIGAGEGSYDKPATGIPATDLTSAVQTSLGKADTALQEHQSLAAYRTSADQDMIDATKGTYSKPADGIPASDLTSAVRTSLGKADTALQEHQSLAAYRTSAAQDVIDATKGTYSKPADGIPATDLTTAAQTSLGKADTALQKGNNTLTEGHILVTDSAGNVADSGKTTADLQDVIYGYLHEGTFYVESAHTTAITPSTTKQYVDMTTATAPAPYMWNGTAYVATGGGMSADHENILASALTDLDERVRSAEHGWLSRGRAMVFSDVINNRTSVASMQPVSAYMMYLQKKEADENERVLGAALCDLFVKTMAQTIIAPEYSTSQSTYSVGDYRTFENNLYKCNTAISEAEFFNPAKWTLTSVMAEISTLLANS